MKTQQKLLSSKIRDRDELYRHYMPFVRGGGLFVPTLNMFRLGDDVFVLTTLEDINEQLPITGKVVWVTPPGAQGNRRAGIGVQFADTSDGVNARKVIEAHLGGLLNRQTRTETL
ncbi:MAG: PilZ domain-containing protein [Gammaproteobacteria bacterium]|jgi:type IV pilus assembly protein PilZ|nr:PilZ domain-containing protein [Gammaproteobacteria bacterium]